MISSTDQYTDSQVSTDLRRIKLLLELARDMHTPDESLIEAALEIIAEGLLHE